MKNTKKHSWSCIFELFQLAGSDITAANNALNFANLVGRSSTFKSIWKRVCAHCKIRWESTGASGRPSWHTRSLKTLHCSAFPGTLKPSPSDISVFCSGEEEVLVVCLAESKVHPSPLLKSHTRSAKAKKNLNRSKIIDISRLASTFQLINQLPISIEYLTSYCSGTSLPILTPLLHTNTVNAKPEITYNRMTLEIVLLG